MQVCTPSQTTTPTSYHSFFLQAGCPSYHPTNSIRALKALTWTEVQSFLPEVYKLHPSSLTVCYLHWNMKLHLLYRARALLLSSPALHWPPTTGNQNTILTIKCFQLQYRSSFHFMTVLSWFVKPVSCVFVKG